MVDRPAPQHLRYVFDSSSLINLERSRELKRLSIPGISLIIPSRVAKEVSRGASPLATWLKKGKVANFVVDSENQLFMKMRLEEQLLSDADIQGIVIANQRKATYVLEEKAARRVAENLGVRCLNTKDFLREFLGQQLSFFE